MTTETTETVGSIYYSVYTKGEKVWLYAMLAEVDSGCLSFYDIDNGKKILVASFCAGYWNYVYEADPETGESIPEQVAFWKKHTPPNIRPFDTSKQRNTPPQ